MRKWITSTLLCLILPAFALFGAMNGPEFHQTDNATFFLRTK